MSVCPLAGPLPWHANHLFNTPFCNNLSLVRRVANLFFHIFTLGIPLAIHYVATHYLIPRGFLRLEAGKEEAAPVVILAADAARQVRLGELMLKLAREELEKHPDLEPQVFMNGWGSQVHQPVNPEIALLSTLFWNKHSEFKETLENNKKDPWSQKEVLDISSECMKIGYAISILTLQDLDPFIKKLQEETGETRSLARALIRQDSYQYQTYFYCTRMYHWIRGGLVSQKGRFGFNDQEYKNRARIEKFYNPKFREHDWRELYNHYCDQITQVVGREALNKERDDRHLRWTEKDMGVNTFDGVPDTLPT